jgi:hypothetical protein
MGRREVLGHEAAALTHRGNQEAGLQAVKDGVDVHGTLQAPALSRPPGSAHRSPAVAGQGRTGAAAPRPAAWPRQLVAVPSHRGRPGRRAATGACIAGRRRVADGSCRCQPDPAARPPGAGAADAATRAAAGRASGHQTTLPPALPVGRPRRSPPPVHHQRPQSALGPVLGRQHLHRFGFWSATATSSRDRRNSSRSFRTVPAWATALVIGSLATSAPGSASCSSPRRPHLPHEAPASPGRGRRRASSSARTAAAAGRGRRPAPPPGSDGSPPAVPARGGGGCRPPAAGGRPAPASCSASPGRMPDGGEHPRAQRINLGQVADDGRGLLSQLLEDGLLELGGGGQVQQAGQGQHPIPSWLDCWICMAQRPPKATILQPSQAERPQQRPGPAGDHRSCPAAPAASWRSPSCGNRTGLGPRY